MFAKKALAPKEKEPFFRFEKAAFRRIGVILRLIAIPVAILGIILAIVLPTVSIEYANYSGSTTFPGDRAYAFVPELIPGYLALFGGDYFYYYLKFKDGPVVLHTALAQTDWVLILVFLVTIEDILQLLVQQLVLHPVQAFAGIVKHGISLLFGLFYLIFIGK